MKRLAVAVVFVALVGSIPVAPASAGGNCVTRHEYRRIEVGMKKARVHHIFGTHGQVIQEGPHREERAYDTCTQAVVFVTYRNSNNTVIAYQWVRGE